MAIERSDFSKWLGTRWSTLTATGTGVGRNLPPDLSLPCGFMGKIYSWYPTVRDKLGYLHSEVEANVVRGGTRWYATVRDGMREQ